jgi:hypothetical protein
MVISIISFTKLFTINKEIRLNGFRVFERLLRLISENKVLLKFTCHILFLAGKIIDHLRSYNNQTSMRFLSQ